MLCIYIYYIYIYIYVGQMGVRRAGECAGQMTCVMLTRTRSGAGNAACCVAIGDSRGPACPEEP